MKRSGLITPFDTAEQAARALVGIQAQMLPATGLALWNRTRGLDRASFDGLLYSQRALVRIWGQRQTLHCYDAATWPLIFAAFRDRDSWMERLLKKRGVERQAWLATVERIGRRLRHTDTLSRDDVRTEELELDEITSQLWNGIFVILCRQGLACHAQPGPRGEARFAHRKVWLPDLEWNPPSGERANLELARRYFGAFGPAHPRDLAHWAGITVGRARRWTSGLGEELVSVGVEGEELLARRIDLPELSESPPGREAWPVRLLHRFDPLLLGLKDKSWLIDPQHYRKVWRPAGHVEPVLLMGGEIRGTWRYLRTSKGIKAQLDPFFELSAPARRAIAREAQRLAGFLELPLLELETQIGS